MSFNDNVFDVGITKLVGFLRLRVDRTSRQQVQRGKNKQKTGQPMTTPSIVIVPNAWRDRFNTCKSGLIKSLSQYAISLRDFAGDVKDHERQMLAWRISTLKSKGMELYRSSDVADVIDRANNIIEATFDPLKEEFIDRFDDIVESQRKDFIRWYDERNENRKGEDGKSQTGADVWRLSVDKTLPSKPELKARLQLMFLPMNMEWSARKFGESFGLLEEAISKGIADEIAQAATELRERLTSGKRFDDSSLNNIKAKIEKLKFLKDLATPDLLRTVEQFEKTLNAQGDNIAKRITNDMKRQAKGLDTQVIGDIKQVLNAVINCSPDFGKFTGGDVEFD